MNDSLKGIRVLVTGAGGFIGSALCEQLVTSGAKVKAFVRYNSRGDPGLLKDYPHQVVEEMEIISGDVRDQDAINQACKGIDFVFHLAALISIPYSYLHPYEVIESNILGTVNVLLASKNNSVQKIIHTSSSEVYGTAESVPMNENHPLKAQSPYAASKIGADKIVESFNCSYDLPVIIVRPFNTYGPRQSLRAVIPSIISQALRSPTIHIGSMDPVRDFTYISDTVNGFIKAATAEIPFGTVIHLGTGKGYSISEVITKVENILVKKFKIITDQERIRPQKSEVLQLVSDNSYARKNLKWLPKVELEEGLELTIDWYKRAPNPFDTIRYIK